MVVYLAVTPDKFELPIGIADTMSGLSKMLCGDDRWAGTISNKLKGKSPNSLEDVMLAKKVRFFARAVEIDYEEETDEST